jgi:hypothetical protein
MRLSACLLVSQPIETTFAWITEPEHIVQWIQSRLDVIEGDTVQPWRISAGEIQDLSAGPLQRGATFRYINSESSSCTIKIMDYASPRTFSFEVFQTGSQREKPGSRHSILLQSVGEETNLSYTITSYPGCLWAFMERLWAPLSRKVLLQRMRELKEQLEAQTVECSAFTGAAQGHKVQAGRLRLKSSQG